MLREFEGRSYAEIAEILGVTTICARDAALPRATLAGRRARASAHVHRGAARHLAVGRRPARTQGAQTRPRPPRRVPGLRALRAPAAAPSLGAARARARADSAVAHDLQGLRGNGSGRGRADHRGLRCSRRCAAGVGTGATTATGGGLLAGGLGLKAAAVVAAASVAGGVGVVGSKELDNKPKASTGPTATQPGARLGQVAPRGVSVPGNGVARGKTTAPGQTKTNKSAAPPELCRLEISGRASTHRRPRPVGERSETSGCGSPETGSSTESRGSEESCRRPGKRQADTRTRSPRQTYVRLSRRRQRPRAQARRSRTARARRLLLRRPRPKRPEDRRTSSASRSSPVRGRDCAHGNGRFRSQHAISRRIRGRAHGRPRRSLPSQRRALRSTIERRATRGRRRQGDEPCSRSEGTPGPSHGAEPSNCSARPLAVDARARLLRPRLR